MTSGLTVESATGAALRAGVRAGDLIVTIDGVAPEDVLDLELAAADGRFTLEVERDGRRLAADVVLGRGEGHGLVLRDVLGVPVRTCANDCTFCFVDQVPAGLRPSLSVKDDDYRLSFLQGTFVTLTNLDEHDLTR
ncbi:MAG TPA: PDZ domain-containing protein, partial [Thermoleophilia bacterium]|nr:PDZ domain-containing protein [Thermoleophilia bacterium]